VRGNLSLAGGGIKTLRGCAAGDGDWDPEDWDQKETRGMAGWNQGKGLRGDYERVLSNVLDASDMAEALAGSNGSMRAAGRNPAVARLKEKEEKKLSLEDML
jgi:hypothetical protein